MKKNSAPHDELLISTKRLQIISDRLHAVLDRERVLAFPAIQYLLAETGPLRRRIDPRELHAALGVLTNHTHLDEGLPHGPLQPRPAIYVTPRITRTNSQGKAGVVALAKEDQLRSFVAERNGRRALAVANVMVAAISGARGLEEVDADRSEFLGGDVHWEAAGACFHVRRRRHSGEACLWVTADFTWIFPDDPRLWRHLLEARKRKSRAIIVARKIAVSTFPLLKRVGAIGLQLHHLYVPNGAPDQKVARRAFAPGPPVHDPPGVATHVAVKKKLEEHLRLATSPDAAVGDALDLALELGLHTDSAGGGLTALRAWMDRSGLEMPSPWKAQLTRYQRWWEAGVS